MAEALAQADGEDDVEKQIEAALACPCLGELRRPHWCLPFARRTIRDLKEGACGPTFVHAFGCFIRSEHEDKGMDCLEQFKAFQVCLQKNPEHLAKIMQADDGADGGAPGQPSEGAQAGGSGSGGGEAAAPAVPPQRQQQPKKP
ncbi:hypothetical protein CHLNCDRAFT_140714 [Chlorella variabilis]|uniref:CHCH domain-containing protein n=1 Tax=Chlorella variabilis TaxID=554065 RepID=E1Z616_CHLVA|nr:hypothetical protein CHLNCDRAFT_140714 [Chlorella variabilis]EFN58569.1 hypothetical protein CHLNCDRAFT_140714 [Chlorella variabilis]|eukprot:XP_005850671.1 hypothetical protein CHLNCDRAFT_140714 [Chlorella variabilis]